MSVREVKLTGPINAKSAVEATRRMRRRIVSMGFILSRLAYPWQRLSANVLGRCPLPSGEGRRPETGLSNSFTPVKWCHCALGRHRCDIKRLACGEAVA